MSTLVRVSHDCGWSGAYPTQRKAEWLLRRHSCEKVRREREAAERGAARAAAVDRTPKPCMHRVAEHEHGTYAAFVLDRCRCLPCAQAKYEYETNRRRQKAYGRWEPYVDARPAAQHLRALSAAGLGWKRVAGMAGVAESSVYPLLYGKHGKGPRARARRELVEAILAVPMPSLADLGDGVVVDGTGTRRRLQALITLGWSVGKIADRCDVGRQALDGALTQRPVMAGTARAVRGVYDALWDQAPPNHTKEDRIAITRSRGRATRAYWAPPLAWDDDTIDDPDALPQHQAETDDELVDDAAVEAVVAGATGVPLSRAERLIVVARLAAGGLSDSVIANRLGVTDRTVLRYRQAGAVESRWAA